MDTSALEGLGLTNNEIKVYACIAESGQISATDIAKQTKLHRPNVYDALNRLTHEGLVSQVLFHEAKFYEIGSPEILIDVLKQKEQKIRELIPQMMIAQKIQGSKSVVRISEGLFAFRQFMRRFLEIKQPIYAFGAPKDVVKWVGEGFINEFHAERVAQKIEMLHIYDTDAKERISALNTMPYTKAGYLPNLAESKMLTMVCGPLCTFTIFTIKPWLIIEVENADLAEANRKYFSIMFKQCKLK
jgi:DNA-binding MarR family transcriptional regulator